jgi:hypothetical protein
MLPSDAPDLPWYKRLFRGRMFLQYWLGGQLQQVWISDFHEKDERTIMYVDYVSRKKTVIRSDSAIAYTLTETK